MLHRTEDIKAGVEKAEKELDFMMEKMINLCLFENYVLSCLEEQE